MSAEMSKVKEKKLDKKSKAGFYAKNIEKSLAFYRTLC